MALRSFFTNLEIVMEAINWNFWSYFFSIRKSAKSFIKLFLFDLKRRQIFTIFDPTPSSRQIFTSICLQICYIFDPSPLKNANILNGWSLIQFEITTFTFWKLCINPISKEFNFSKIVPMIWRLSIFDQ